MRRFIPLWLLLLLLLVGCKPATQPPAPTYTKYQYQFFDTFDTVIQLTGYTTSEEEFRAHAEAAHAEFIRLHKLFDRFNSYEGMTNIHTLNQNAGGQPLVVDSDLLSCLSLSVDWYHRSGGRVNVAMGSVTDLWQRHTSAYGPYSDPASTTLPDPEELLRAGEHISIESVVIDPDAGTVQITDPEMLLDLGSTAKGYATEQVARLLESRGFKSFILSAGGNVRCGDGPLDDLRPYWGIGLENPDPSLIQTDSGYLDVLFTTHMSVVSSGDYQRYYFYGDQRIHHLIDPDTLYPGERYRSVIVVAPDSGDCDALSTAVFLLDMESGRALAESVGAEVLWVTPDGQVTVTEGLVPHLRERGGATNTH